MENLKFLIVYNINICEALKDLPNGLRFLHWGNYPFPLPSKYCPQKLVALKMPDSHIRLEKAIQACMIIIIFIISLNLYF